MRALPCTVHHDVLRTCWLSQGPRVGPDSVTDAGSQKRTRSFPRPRQLGDQWPRFLVNEDYTYTSYSTPRLSFPAFPNGPSHGVDCPCKKCRAVPREGWHTDAWAAWFVLAWLRLVRATHSRRTAAWHGAQHERRRKLRTGSDTGDAAAGMLGDTRTNRADARTHRRHSQQQHSWVNDQLPPERLRCYWGCRGECRPAVHSTPPTDGEESDGDKSSSGGHESDGSTRSDADAGAPAKRRRVGHDTPTDMPAAPQPPRRTRRTDTILQLRAPARLALHIRLADADARLTHGRKRRNDT